MPRKARKRIIVSIALPLLLFGLIAPFTPAIDLYISGLFYTSYKTFYSDALMQFLFRYGELFGFFSGGLAVFCFFLSFLFTKFKKWRRPLLALTLTLILGAGLITNTLLKGYWGRPRPKQIIEFGGHYSYRPFWRPNFDRDREPQKSFPSGHVAMGFYFLSLCLVGKRHKSPLLFRMGLCLTIGLGGTLMITRVAQGGHFVSDVLVSALLMWLVALLMDRATSEGWEKRVFFLKQLDTAQEAGEVSNDL